ncbi:MAG: hypothetical protein ACJ765_09850, partial [Chloroflexota bacterium]
MTKQSHRDVGQSSPLSTRMAKRSRELPSCRVTGGQPTRTAESSGARHGSLPEADEDGTLAATVGKLDPIRLSNWSVSPSWPVYR